MNKATSRREVAGATNRDSFPTHLLLDSPPRAARMLLDTGAPEPEAIEFLRRFGLMSEDRARKYLDFVRTYRSYVFNYTAGDDLVRDYIGDGPDRVERFFDLLERSATPSGRAMMASCWRKKAALPTRCAIAVTALTNTASSSLSG